MFCDFILLMSYIIMEDQIMKFTYLLIQHIPPGNGIITIRNTNIFVKYIYKFIIFICEF